MIWLLVEDYAVGDDEKLFVGSMFAVDGLIALVSDTTSIICASP